MADARDKASPGDPLRIRAATWNQLVDIVEETAGGPGESTKSGGGRVTISLNATTHINPYSVVGFSNPVWAIDDSDDVQDRNDSATLDSTAPAVGEWAICQGGAHIGDNVNAVLVGVTWAKINITDVSHKYCDYIGNELASAENGYARILWKPPAVTGEKWVVLQLGCSQGVAESGGGGSNQCVCGAMEAQALLIQQLELDGTLTKDSAALIRGNLIQTMQSCECVSTTPCANCDSLESPQTMLVDISGVTDVAFGGGLAEPDFTLDPLSGYVNGQHSFTMSCTGFLSPIIDGVVEYSIPDIPIGPGGIGGTKTLTLRLTLQFGEYLPTHRWRIIYELFDTPTTLDQHTVQGQAITTADCWSPENSFSGAGSPSYIDITGWSVFSRPQY